MSERVVASSATLVTSAMESAGYHYQAHILDALIDPLTSSVGALFYTLAIATAIIQTVVFGKYKFSRWLIIGPVLFVSVLTARDEYATPRWKFAGIEQEPLYEGSEQDYERAVKKTAEKVEVVDVRTANVASLFAGYNKLVSSITQELVKVIADIRQDERLNGKFLIRPQLHGLLTSSVSSNDGFRELLHAGFFAQCAPALHSAHEVINVLGGQRHNAERRSELDKALNGTKINLNDDVPSNTKALGYLGDLRVDYQDLWRGLQGRTPDQYIEEIRNKPVIQGSERLALRDKAISAILAETNGMFSCKELWDIAYAGLLIEASKKVDNEMRLAGDKYGDVAKLPEELLKVEGLRRKEIGDGVMNEAHALNQLTRVVARNMFANHVSQPNSIYPTFVSRLVAEGGKIDPTTSMGVGDLNSNYRHLKQAEEWAQKSEAFTYAENLPYYQGVVLFFLAICFPFFAIMLLVPDKYSVFMNWFFLWMWAKSWDVGLAIVMSLEDLLWTLLVEGQQALRDNAADVLPGLSMEKAQLMGETLDQALLSLEYVDPTFGPTIYYTIIGTALSAIPVITSQLILGAASAGSGLIASGMKMQAADAAGDASGLVTGQHAIMNARGLYNDAIASHVQTALHEAKSGNFPEALNSLTGDARKEAYQILGGDGRQGFGLNHWINSSVGNLDAAASAAAFGQEFLKNLRNTPVKSAQDWVSAGWLSDEGQLKNLGVINELQSAMQGQGDIKLRKAAEELLGLIRKSAIDARETKLMTIARWAEADAIDSDYGHYLSSVPIFYRSLPLHWYYGTEAYTQQGNQNLLAATQQIQAMAYLYNQGQNLVSSALSNVPKAATTSE